MVISNSSSDTRTMKLTRRLGTGKVFRFLKTMSLFVGACGALNTSISILFIIISRVFSSYSFWKLVLLPLPSLVGAISFVSLLYVSPPLKC